MSNCFVGKCRKCGDAVAWMDEKPSYHICFTCDKKEIGEKTPDWVIEND
jgi:hypothetical protein